jgi:hypothetical protein
MVDFWFVLHVTPAINVHHTLGIGFRYDLTQIVTGRHAKYEIEVVCGHFGACLRVDRLCMHSNLDQVISGVDHLGGEEKQRADQHGLLERYIVDDVDSRHRFAVERGVSPR